MKATPLQKCIVGVSKKVHHLPIKPVKYMVLECVVCAFVFLFVKVVIEAKALLIRHDSPIHRRGNIQDNPGPDSIVVLFLFRRRLDFRQPIAEDQRQKIRENIGRMTPKTNAKTRGKFFDPLL